MEIIEKAPAKINLSLDVLYKREDGFHELEMVMTTVDLADRIALKACQKIKSSFERQMVSCHWIVVIMPFKQLS